MVGVHEKAYKFIVCEFNIIHDAGISVIPIKRVYTDSLMVYVYMYNIYIPIWQLLSSFAFHLLSRLQEQ